MASCTFHAEKNVKMSRDHFRKLCKLCHFVDVLFRCIRIYKYKGGIKLGMLSPCHTKQRCPSHCTALWGRRETCLKISNLPVIQRPHSVPTASLQRPYSVHTNSYSVLIASMTLLRRASSCCTVFTASTQRSHSVHTSFSQ